MSELRWILLGLGVLIIAGVYFSRGRKFGLHRLRREKADNAGAHQRREPSLSGDGSVQSFSRLIAGAEDVTEVPATARDSHKNHSEQTSTLVGDPGEIADTPPPEAASAAQGPQKIIVLHVAARGSQRFAGAEVVSVLQAEGLRHGRFQIFHWHRDENPEPVFSVASMVEPGSFDLASIAEVTTPGLSLFLVLPGPEDATESFSQMLITARSLAQKLGGEVLDEHGSSLSNQTAGHIREEIVAFQLRLRALEDMHA